LITRPIKLRLYVLLQHYVVITSEELSRDAWTTCCSLLCSTVMVGIKSATCQPPTWHLTRLFHDDNPQSFSN